MDSLHLEKIDYGPFIVLASVDVKKAIAYLEKIFNNLKFQ